MSEYSSGVEDVRPDLTEAIEDYRREQSRALIGDFEPDNFDPREQLLAHRRGHRWAARPAPWASPRHLLNLHDIHERFAGHAGHRAAGGGPGHRRLRRVPRPERPKGVRGRRLERRRDRPPFSARPGFPRRSAATWPPSSSWSPTRWRSGPPACWRTRSTNRLRASTRRSCCPTSTPTPISACDELRVGSQGRLRLRLLPAGEDLPRGQPLPTRRGEDGRHHPAGRGEPARPPLLP